MLLLHTMSEGIADTCSGFSHNCFDSDTICSRIVLQERKFLPFSYLLQLIFQPMSLALVQSRFCRDQLNRQSSLCVLRPLAVIMAGDASLKVICASAIQRAIRAFQQIHCPWVGILLTGFLFHYSEGMAFCRVCQQVTGCLRTISSRTTR